MNAQRLRFRYRLDPEALGMKHRDIVDAWVSALASGGCEVALSEGKRPAPRVSLGAPLPQGVTSDCELVDVYLARPADPAAVLAALAGRFPPGIEAVGVEEVGLDGPSLQSLVRWAEYEVWLSADELSETRLQAGINNLLEAESQIVERQKESGLKRYDIRPLVLGARMGGAGDGGLCLRLRLRAEQDATARADDAVAALGLPPALRVHRVALHLEDVPTVIAAYRRSGEPGAAAGRQESGR